MKLVMIFVLGIFGANSLSWAHGTLHEQIRHTTDQIKSTPKEPRLYLKRGEIYREHQEWEKAESDYKKVRELSPALAGIDLAEARLAFARKQWEEALNLVNTHLELDAEDLTARHLRAKILGELKKYEQAAADYSRYLKSAKAPQPYAFLERAEVQRKAGDITAAIKGLDEAIALLGNQVTLQEQAIELERKAGLYDQALHRIDRVMASLNRKESWLDKKADLLAEAGNLEQAQKHYHQALALISELPKHLQTTKYTMDLKAAIEAKLKLPAKLAGQ